MRNFRELTEANGTVVFTFGRFNPPTTGHEKLVQKVASVSGSSPFRIYPSYSQNPKKDPLPFALKIAYMRKMFPRYAKNIVADKDARTAINIAVKLYDEGFANLIMVAGSDRVKEFQSLLNTYNGVEGKRHGFYKFDTIDVVSAGERDPDAEGVEGMSASKMRAAASAGDFDSFKTGLPSGFRDTQKLYNDVRKYMGIREERDMGQMTDFETLRDNYLTGKLWNIGDLVEANGVEGKIIRKGTNYVAFCDSTGKVHKAWLHEVELNERPNYLRGGYFTLGVKGGSSRGEMSYYDAMTYITKEGGDIKKIRNMKSGDTYTFKTRGGKTGYVTKEEVELDERNYANEYKNYHSRPEQIARRSSRNKAQRLMGTIDGMDVHHKDNNPLNNDPENLEHMDRSENRREPRLREREVKQDKDVKGREGTQPAKYYAKGAKGSDISPATKAARARHFEKKKKGPAPGDASAETKPSKHTKKFKQMYGEVKIKEKLGKDATVGDYIDDFRKSDSPQFKGKSDKKIQKMAVAAYLDRRDKNEELDERNLTKSQQDRLDDLESYLGHLQRITLTPSRKAEIEATKKKIKKLKSEFDPDDLDESWSIDEMTGINVPELIRTTVHRLTHPKGYERIIQKYIQDISMERQKSGSKNTNAAILADVARLFGFDRVKPLQMYVNKLVKKGKLPQELAAEFDPDVDESLWANIHKKRQRIKRGSGEKMRKKGEKGAPTAAQMKRAKGESIEEKAPNTKDAMKRFKAGDAGFTDKAHLKAKGLIPRADGTKKKSPKYEEFPQVYHLDEKITALVNKAKKTGMPYGILKKVYDRGMAAYKTGHRRGATPQQWALARVNSFTTKSSGTWGGADKDLAKQVRGESVEILKNNWGEVTEAAEYQGRKVQLNNPTKGDTKKYKVYVRNDKGNVVKVEFGDPNMSIKRDDPERRKAFRARHGCDTNPGPKHKAKYWSCKFWSSKSVTDLMKG